MNWVTKRDILSELRDRLDLLIRVTPTSTVPAERSQGETKGRVSQLAEVQWRRLR